MKLPAEFLQLPLRFDAARLQAEIDAVPASAWRPHPQGFVDNDALLLVTAGGGQNDDLAGTMAPTPVLDRCPYLQQVMASFATVIGRSRLMRIGGAAEAKPHFDENYYWHQRMRVHVPIRTSPGVRFHCGDRSVHMQAGECWVFDTWKIHKVTNPDSAPRVHLVCDTVGSGPFWDLLARSSDPYEPRAGFRPTEIPYAAGESPRLHFETTNAPEVMSPWEQESLIAAMLDDLRAADPPAEVERQLQAVLERFRFQWRGLWARYGAGAEGYGAYRRALDGLRERLDPFAGQLQFPNGADVFGVLDKVLIGSAMTPPAPATSANDRQARPGVRMGRPVVIAAAPRSGSTLLFETMARSPVAVTVGGESHGVIEGVPALDPAGRGFASNALSAEDADRATIETLRQRFVQAVRAHEGEQGLAAKGPEVRLLEKTPKNALRLPFLRQVFPGMQLVYLVRHPRENISSIIDAWRSGRFVTYPRLPGWNGPPWSLLLIPGWRDLPADDVATIAARQWQAAHEAILDALDAAAFHRVVPVRYETLIDDPRGTLEFLCSQLDLAPPRVDGELPLSRHTLTRPDPDKWKRNAEALERVLPMVETTWQRIQRRLEAAD
ncbi:sulfotransferase [Halomonas denitrificans]|nr:sulfotransferase [Halomonas denitrificans]